jgi:hypothetical protein
VLAVFAHSFRTPTGADFRIVTTKDTRIPEIVTLLTSRELATLLNCSERKLERHRLVGDGPPFLKIGASIRYPLNELEKWLADRLQRSTSEPK